MSRTAAAAALAAALAVVPAGAGSAATTSAGAAEVAAPTVVAVPPATSHVDVAPVLHLRPGPLGLRAPVSPLIASTASADGALTVDEGPKERRYTLAGDVFFEPTSAELTDRARTDLAALAARLWEESASEVTVVGHTDDIDTDASNQQLSERRAEAVRAFLEETAGVPVGSEGRGESEPVATNDTDEGRALNRRVEINAQIG